MTESLTALLDQLPLTGGRAVSGDWSLVYDPPNRRFWWERADGGALLTKDELLRLASEDRLFDRRQWRLEEDK